MAAAPDQFYMSVGTNQGVSGSSHYLRLGKWGILLDAGLDPHRRMQDEVPDFNLLRNQPVNAIVISHAHLDHLGALPLAVRNFPHARVYMTPATAALAELMLFHYLKVQQNQHHLEHQRFQPHYTAQDVENILFLFQSFGYRFPFKIHGFQESDIELVFWDAGHILGSAGIEIRWRGKRIFYTGNTKRSPQFILKGAQYPNRTDILITESTYGDNSRAPLIRSPAEITRFAEFINQRLDYGGAVLIPVFALGRTQEIMMLLHRLITRRKIPPTPIYLTGMGLKINRIYDRLLHKIYPAYQPRLLQIITFDTLRSRHYRKPAIILATSGMMLPNTLSYEIAGDFLTDRRNGIAMVGWADPETPGGSLREKKVENIMAAFKVQQVHCAMENFYFSAHSHREELLHMVRDLSPKKTILCHGDPPALQWMKDQIEESHLCRDVFIPQQGEMLPI